MIILLAMIKMKTETDLMVSSHATDETEITLVTMEILLSGSYPARFKTRHG